MNKYVAYLIVLSYLKDERFLTKLNNDMYKILFPDSMSLEIEAYKRAEVEWNVFLFELLKEVVEKEIGEYIDGENRFYPDFLTDGMIFQFRVKEGMESDFLRKMGHEEGSDSLIRLKRRFSTP